MIFRRLRHWINVILGRPSISYQRLRFHSQDRFLTGPVLLKLLKGDSKWLKK